MSREVRHVAKDWKHPTECGGSEANLKGIPYQRRCYIPLFKKDMPQWSEEEKTHLQLYETTSEGTPMSPVFDCEIKLAKWLAKNKVSAYGFYYLGYECWLNFIQGNPHQFKFKMKKRGLLDRIKIKWWELRTGIKLKERAESPIEFFKGYDPSQEEGKG